MLAISYQCEQTLQKILEAGILPVIINAVKAHVQSLRKDAALQPDAEPPCDSNGNKQGSAPAPGAVVAALSICEVSSL